MQWRIAEAKERFSEMLRAAGEEPQLILNRDRLVAAVIDPETFRAFEEWRHREKESSIEDAFAELRQIHGDDEYILEVPPRWNRPNAFADAPDDIPR
jgi:hypothetical protein